MPAFQVRNRATGAILGDVTVEDPDDLLDALRNKLGMGSVEELIAGLGATLSEAKNNLEIVDLAEPPPRGPTGPGAKLAAQQRLRRRWG